MKSLFLQATLLLCKRAAVLLCGQALRAYQSALDCSPSNEQILAKVRVLKQQQKSTAKQQQRKEAKAQQKQQQVSLARRRVDS